MAANTEAGFSRPNVVFPPSLLVLLPELACLSPDDSDYKSYTQQVELLVEQVKAMLVDLKTNAVEKVKLIYLLRRLGVSYHFETEIECQLDQMFCAKTPVDDTHDYDLCTVSLIFQVFRQYGYKMPCDVFNKFKDGEGDFKDTLQKDVEGLLSLYEATHLAMNGEDILDEALAYTTMHLKALADESSPRLATYIAYALRQPYYKGIPLIESRRYISFYQEDDLCVDILLKLAKLDTNRLQLLHQKEINEILMWHRGLNYEEKLPYSRHRPIEGYLWSMGVFFEPQYSIARIFLTKFIILLTYTDDTYDSFGSTDELRLLRNAMQRWDIDLMNEAPESMRLLCKDFLNLFLEQESIFKNKGATNYDLSYAIDAVKGLFGYYQQEVEWLREDYTPIYEEYIKTALHTTCYHVVVAVAFAGMTEVAGVKDLEWLQSFPKINWAIMIICRLMDDIVSTQREQEHVHIPTAIACYMKTHDVSIEETVEEFKRNITKAWKDINAEFITTKSISRHLLMIFVNCSRIIDVLYKDNDSFTETWHLKDPVKALFLDVIPM